MEEIQHRPVDPEVNDSYLDVLLVLAENARLLVVGPLSAGLVALAICFFIPQTYQSVAVLQADSTTASLMQTSAVLDPVIASLGLDKDSSLEQARIKLRDQIRVVVGRTDKLLTLTVSGPSPLQAQASALALMQRTFQESRPKGSVRQRFEVQLAEARARFKNAQAVGENLQQRLESPASPTSVNAEVARGYAELLSAMAAAQSQILLLESQLEGLGDAQVVQFPTLPEQPNKPKKAQIAVGATLAVGLVLLFYVFMRRTVSSWLANENALAKFNRMRQALGLR